MGGFFGDAGLLSHLTQLFWGDALHADVRQTHRQAHIQAEVQDFHQFLSGGVLQHHVAEGAERHFLTVHIFVGAGQDGQAVHDAVGRRQTAALKAQAGQQDVGLNDVLQGGGDYIHVAGLLGLPAVGHQGLIALGRQRKSGVGAHAGSAHALTGAAGQACVDPAEGPHVGTGLEIGGQCVAHAGNQEAGGSLGNHGGVNQNYAGALLEVGVIVKRRVLGVQHGGVAGGSIRGGDGRADNHAVALAHALGGVDGLAAAQADGAGAVILLGDLTQAGNLLPGALAPEVAQHELHAELLRRSVQLGLNAGHVVGVGNQQRRISERFDKIAQVQQLVLALHVLCGTDKCLSHN